MVKETVGALYYAFNTPDASGNFTTTYEENVTKSNVVKIQELQKTLRQLWLELQDKTIQL